MQAFQCSTAYLGFVAENSKLDMNWESRLDGRAGLWLMRLVSGLRKPSIGLMVYSELFITLQPNAVAMLSNPDGDAILVQHMIMQCLISST
jgi:hypothetical protein